MSTSTEPPKLDEGGFRSFQTIFVVGAVRAVAGRVCAVCVCVYAVLYAGLSMRFYENFKGALMQSALGIWRLAPSSFTRRHSHSHSFCKPQEAKAQCPLIWRLYNKVKSSQVGAYNETYNNTC